jgi:NADH-quinone oxidoreductase subunit A
VNHGVGAVDDTRNAVEVGEGAFDEFDVQRIEVRAKARREVIEGNHTVDACRLRQPLTQVRTDEPGPAGDNHPHAVSFVEKRLTVPQVQRRAVRLWRSQRRLSKFLGVLAEVANSGSEFLRDYLIVVIEAAIGIGLVGLLLGLSWLLRPARRQEQKHMTYESGVDPVGSIWTQSQVRYYIFAVLFVLFDVEAVFIFPWATRLETYGTFGLIEMGVFVFILLLGLVYAWRKGVLKWV